MKRTTLASGVLMMSLALTLAACSSVPFERTPLVATAPATAGELVGGHWLAAPGVYRCRQTALFELRGSRLPLEGFMELDTGSHTARLVALDGMGLKLLDLTVTSDGYRQHHLLPALGDYPGLAEAVALSVRRIFLAPRPGPGDTLETGRREYRLLQEEGGENRRFVFGGAGPYLIETTGAGESGRWRVRYYQYRPGPGHPIPEGAVLEDRRAGFRLTLWLEDVRKIDG
ncbi:MAG: hypothetical protein C0617_04990 [Desulfuromonas sp.]|uniref:hypothetical protein n=1 Tax=Desulfuromonas sp. TaxID=892 RepID=UPI000CBA1BE4|nr:hypothetical protein [Desulfuromonas sp.]PLX85246.1 MAG: hypothetical protein C0617_04990 [Desulfuromonas sp.]